jgi:dTDP-4-dehydrorhamnose reductase
VYHVSNAGVATWWDLARRTLDLAGFPDLAINRIRTEDLDLPARRPRWSVLECSKAEAEGVRLRIWQEALRAYLESDISPLAGPEES